MKKILALALALVFIFLVACSAAPTSESTSQPETQTPENTTQDETETTLNTEDDIELTILLTPQWRGVFDQNVEGADYPDFFEYAAEEFNKMYPNVNVNVQVVAGSERGALINANLQGGTPPDIVFDVVMVLTDYAHMGALLPLDELVDDEALSDISEGTWDSCKVADQLFFYPYSQNLGFYIVNNEHMIQAGKEDMLPEPGNFGTWTPEEFKDTLTALKENVTTEGFYPFGFYCSNNQSDQFNSLFLTMYGGSLFNEDSSASIINSEEGVQAMEFVKGMYDEGLFQPSPESVAPSTVREMFNNQQLGVCHTFTSMYLQLQSQMELGEIPAFETSIFMLPGEEQPQSFNMTYGFGAFDTEDEDRIAYAKEFIKFCATDPELVVASATHAVPVRQTVIDQTSADKPYIETMSQVFPYFVDYTGGINKFIEFRNLMFPTYQAVLTGTKDVQTAMDDFANDATSLIEEGREESVLY